MLNIIKGGAGTGKSTLLMDRIDTAVLNGKNVLVIIPDQFSFEYDRLLYNRLGIQKFNMINVLSFSRLAKDIFIKHGGIKGKYADDIVKNILMHRTIAEINNNEGLHFYNKQAKTSGFIEKSLEIVKELALSNISPEMLVSSVNFLNDNLKEKVTDISVIYSEYSRILAKSGYKDGLNDISAAADKAKTHGYFNGLDVFVDEFKSFTADERALLDVIISDSNSFNICLTTEDTVSAAFSVFETVNKTLSQILNIAKYHNVQYNINSLSEGVRFLSPEINYLSKNILRNSRKSYDENIQNVSVFEALDFYNEADFICSEICRLVMEEGYKYSEIAVTSRQKALYSSVMEGAFERYEIPFYTDENSSIKHKSLMIFILSALRIASDKNPDTEDFLRYIKTNFTVLDEKQIDVCEEYCYKWNVTAKMWKSPFVDENTEIIRKIICEPLFKLSEKCNGTNAKAICHALFEFFYEIKLDEKIKEITSDCKSTNPAVLMAVREYKQLWEMLCSLLETLYSVLGDMKISLAHFTDIFEACVSELTLSSPPQTLDCVSFVSANTARLANPRAVFVIGVNDGILPYSVKNTGLFSDRDRLSLENAGIELGGASYDKIAEERFVAYNILSAPSEKLFISYSLSNTSGSSLYPSMLIKQANEILPNLKIITSSSLDILNFCRTPHSSYYQYVQNFNKNSIECASVRNALMQTEIYSAKIFLLDALKSQKQFSLDKKISHAVFGKRMAVSPSAFETYYKCPFAYFCKNGLHIYPRKRVDISSAAQGNVIHYCLSEIFSYLNSENIPISMAENSFLRSTISVYMEKYYNSSEIKGDYGKTKRFLQTYKRLADTVFNVVLHLKEELSQSEFSPSDFEYTLSFDGDEAPLRLTSNDGTEIFFIGKIDRIDTYKNEIGETFIRVVDYKSGNQTFSLSNLLYGLNMQMFLYLFALTDSSPAKKDGKYKNAHPAGVLYMPAKDVAPSLERHDTDTEKHINKTYKMNGLILENHDIIHAMEKDTQGIYIPVKYKTDGSFYSSSLNNILNSNQFENLRSYSKKLILEMADNIKSGVIPASPLVNNHSAPCDYCDYYGLCGYSDDQSLSREINKEAAQSSMLDILNNKEADSDEC